MITFSRQHASDVDSVVVVLPSYNEATSLPLLLERLDRTGRALDRPLKILVVDDGSTDDTCGVGRSVGAGLATEVVVIEHASNQGLGGAMQTGLSHGAAMASVVVTMDADNTHEPDLIPLMLSEIDEGADVVVASRYAPGAGMVGVPFHRRILSDGARMVLGRLSGARGVKDFTCGYRAYRSDLIRRLIDMHGEEDLVRERSFACQFEVLRKGAAAGAQFREIPLMLRFDQKSSPSEMRIFHTLGGYIRVLSTPSRPSAARRNVDDTVATPARSGPAKVA